MNTFLNNSLGVLSLAISVYFLVMAVEKFSYFLPKNLLYKLQKNKEEYTEDELLPDENFYNIDAFKERMNEIKVDVDGLYNLPVTKKSTAFTGTEVITENYERSVSERLGI